MKDVNGQILHSIKLNLGLDLDVVKAASSDELKKEQSLESKYYANPLDKTYPTHTKEATERSIVYFFGGDEEKSNYPRKEASERLYKAARFWNIADHYYTVKNASQTVSALPEVSLEFAFIDKLPISTEEQIRKSASALVEQADKLTFNDRSEAAFNILKAAADRDLNLGIPELEVMSGVLPKDPEKISKSLLSRKASFDRLGIGSEIYKAAAEAVTSCNEDELDEICGLIDTFERSKSASRVGRSLSPIETCFFDQAPNETLIHLSNGTDVLFSQIKQASLTPFYALGATIPLKVTDEEGNLDCEKTASFLECIPKEDCDLFEKVLNSCL